MKKIIPNRCDKQGNAYITLSDILGQAIHYDNGGKFEYIQSSSGNRYMDLQSARIDINLRLIDPTAEPDQANILAKNTAKNVEVEVDPKVNNCVKLNQKNISIDTTRHGCSIEKLLGTDDTVKINLKDGVKLNQEFAQLGGNVSFSENCKWINLGLNECELSQYKVKVTDDCRCKPDTEAFKELRNDITVKSAKSGQKVGSVNLSAWYFEGNKLYYDSALDKIGSKKVGGETYYYFKIIPCSEKEPYYKLALCDKNGSVITETEGRTGIHISKCNLIGRESIELKDFVREDGLPSFIIKPSISKEFGEAIGSKSRAEIYQYDPISDKIGSEVGKLSATFIIKYNNKLYINNYLLDSSNFKSFDFDKETSISVTKQDDSYQLSGTLHSSDNEKITKLLFNDLLCLFDQNSLQDGIQIIG